MKKLNFVTANLLFLVMLLASCEKDSIINTHDRVGSSRVTYFAKITVTGAPVISVIKGGSFTDPGAKAVAGDAEVPVVTTGTVNTGQVGLYTINYSAVNADGYSSSASRTVVVIPNAELPGLDISGTYNAVPVGNTPGPATITKVAPGVYHTTNCWGNSGAVIPAYFICTDGSSLIVPSQNSAYGNLETNTPGVFNAGLITWTINLTDQGVARTKKWQKQ